MQVYKSLCAADTIHSTLINIQTHTHGILISLFDKLSHLSEKFMDDSMIFVNENKNDADIVAHSISL